MVHLFKILYKFSKYRYGLAALLAIFALVSRLFIVFLGPVCRALGLFACQYAKSKPNLSCDDGL